MNGETVWLSENFNHPTAIMDSPHPTFIYGKRSFRIYSLEPMFSTDWITYITDIKNIY